MIYRWYVVRSRIAAKAAEVRRLWIPLTVALAALAIWLWNSPRLSSLSVLTARDSLVSVFAAIAGVLSSIVGISIAAVLVVLQVLRTTYSSSVVRVLLREFSFEAALWLYVVTIALAVAGIVSIGNPAQPRTGGLATLALLLFALCLVELPRAAARFMSFTRIGTTRIQSLAASISLGSLGGNVGASLFTLREGIPLGEGDDDPLFLLGDIASRGLRERDRVLPRVVIRELLIRLIALMEHGKPTQGGDVGQYWRRVIAQFLTPLRLIALTAAEIGDERTIEDVLYGLAEIHRLANEHQLPWYTVVELNETIAGVADRCLTFDLPHAAQVAIIVIERAQGSSLDLNVTGDDKPWLYFTSPSSEPGAGEQFEQWHQVESTYPMLIRRIVLAAAKSSNDEVASSGIFALGGIASRARGLERLGPRQRTSLIDLALFNAADCLIRFVDTTGRVPSLGFSPFTSFHLSADLANGELWAPTWIRRTCSVARELGVRGMVSEVMLNEVGAIARGTVRAVVEDGTVAQAVMLLAQAIVFVADQAAEKQVIGAAELARAAAEQLQSIVKWGNGHLDKAPALQDQLNGLTQHARNLASELAGQRFDLGWPSLSPVDGKKNPPQTAG